MKPLNAAEEKAQQYYENFWSERRQIGLGVVSDGFHFGFYEKGIKTRAEALRTMNDYIGRCINLEPKTSMQILDAGCGIGATSLYLAKKYPHAFFTGVTLAPSEVALAMSAQKKRNIPNARFLIGTFADLDFPNNFFDGAFALESICYASSKKEAIGEISRVIKPNGKLVIIDGFLCNNLPLNSFMQNIYLMDLEKRALPHYASIDEMKRLLEDAGFIDISIRDLSKTIAYFYLYGGILFGVYYMLTGWFQRNITQRKTKHKEDSATMIKGAGFIELLLGVTKKTGYYAITATKKEAMK